MQDLEAVLRRHPFCLDMRDAHVQLLVGCASNEKFAAGERLFRNGQDADRTFLIRAGMVALEVEGPTRVHRLETVGEGELVGWSWLFPPYEWHFDAVALQSVRALALDGACLRRKCEEDTTFGYEMVRRVLYQAHKRLERSRLQVLDVFEGSA